MDPKRVRDSIKCVKFGTSKNTSYQLTRTRQLKHREQYYHRQRAAFRATEAGLESHNYVTPTNDNGDAQGFPVTGTASDTWSTILSSMGIFGETDHVDHIRQIWTEQWLRYAILDRKRAWHSDQNGLRRFVLYLLTYSFPNGASRLNMSSSEVSHLHVLKLVLEELARHTNVAIPIVERVLGLPNPQSTDKNLITNDDNHDDVCNESRNSDDSDENDASGDDDDNDDDVDADETMQWVLEHSETVQLFGLCRQTLLLCGNLPFDVLDALLSVCALLWTVPQATQFEIPSKTVDVNLAVRLLSYVTEQDSVYARANCCSQTGELEQTEKDHVTWTPYADAMATCLMFLQHALPAREQLVTLEEAHMLRPILDHITTRASGNARVAMYTLGILQVMKHVAVSVTGQHKPLPLLLQPEWIVILARMTSSAQVLATPDRVRNWGPVDDAWRMVHLWTEQCPSITSESPQWVQLVLRGMDESCSWLHSVRAIDLTQSSNNIFMLESRLWTLRVAREMIQGPLSDLPNEHVSSLILQQRTHMCSFFESLLQALVAAGRVEQELCTIINVQSSTLSSTAVAVQSRGRRMMPFVTMLQTSILNLLTEIVLATNRTTVANYTSSTVLIVLQQYLTGLQYTTTRLYEAEIGQMASRQIVDNNDTSAGSSSSSSHNISTSFNSASSVLVTSYRVAEEGAFAKLSGIAELLEVLLYAPFSETWWQMAIQSPIWNQMAKLGECILSARSNLNQVVPKALVNVIRAMYHTLAQAYPPSQSVLLEICHPYLLQAVEDDESSDSDEDESDEEEEEEDSDGEEEEDGDEDEEEDEDDSME